jgi:hypothetical protein
MKTGEIASHGSLPIFREDEAALRGAIGESSPRLILNDNFLTLEIEADDLMTAYERGIIFAEQVCQSLTVQGGYRYSATFQFIEDEHGSPKQIRGPKVLPMGSIATFNLEQLRARFAKARTWAMHANPRVQKALLYAEHACTLSEFAQSQGLLSTHAAFSRALAFLQLWKALTLIVGDPATDRDHQRRFREIGLPDDFLERRVRPLYRVRNEEDVAHYSETKPSPGAFSGDFGKAMTVLSEALDAYIFHLSSAALPRDTDA